MQQKAGSRPETVPPQRQQAWPKESSQGSPLDALRTCVTAVTAKPSVLAAAITLALCFSAAHTTLAMVSDAACSGSAAAAVTAAVGRR